VSVGKKQEQDKRQFRQFPRLFEVQRWVYYNHVVKIVFILFVLAVLSLPVKVFGQTSVTGPVQKSISLPATTTKPVPPTPPQQTPITKHVGPGLKETRKIEIKPADETKKIEITDDKGITKTVEPEKLNEVIISPDPEKCKPKPCTVLTLKIENGKTVINSDGVITKTSLPVKIEGNRITVETKNRDVDVEVLDPSKVKGEIESYAKAQPNTLTITSTSLDSCDLQGDEESLCSGVSSVYKVDTIRQNKFLGLLPVKSNVKYTLNASTGNTISEESPWYLKILPFLFN